jgi:hypothetical protein
VACHFCFELGCTQVDRQIEPGETRTIHTRSSARPLKVHAATAEARRAMGQEVRALNLRGMTATRDRSTLWAAEPIPPRWRAAFPQELIERGVDEGDMFRNEWAETVITGGATQSAIWEKTNAWTRIDSMQILRQVAVIVTSISRNE